MIYHNIVVVVINTIITTMYMIIVILYLSISRNLWSLIIASLFLSNFKLSINVETLNFQLMLKL